MTKIVVGLGNPGRKYRQTRHNIGAAVVQELERRKGLRSTRSSLATVAAAEIAGEQVVLARPRTYVNESGRAVQSLLRRSRLQQLEDLLVVVDDMELPLGTLRLRPNGSDGGHNGLRSIIEAVGSRSFPRLRIGIGRPPAGVDPIDYVLGEFGLEERETLGRAQLTAADAVEHWAEHGIAETMNRFNPIRPAGGADQ